MSTKNAEIPRDIEQKIKHRLFEPKKISIIYGPRQVGKTTLAKKLLEEFNGNPETGYFTCESNSIQDVLASANADKMYQVFSGHKVIVLDEAQKFKNIGQALKLLIDAHPELAIIATGSSSFELASSINEPLTGRHYEYFLYPISANEIKNHFSYLKLQESLSDLLIYGSYPEILLSATLEDKYERLGLLTTSYLYKDIFEESSIRNPEILSKILRALALQVGGEVSYSEIASLVGADKKTIMSYIRLLEQAFIIFRLPPLGSNARNEIKKMPKFYFYDNGILNSLISNYNGEDYRDMGPLWENFMITERKKYNQLHSHYHHNCYYWRLTSGHEVDYIEDYGGTYHPYEFKYRKDSLGKGAAKFASLYNAETTLINRNNFENFILG